MVFSEIFLYACLTFVCGIGVASFIQISGFLFLSLVAFVPVLFLSGLFFKKHFIVVCAILLAFFALGFWRFESIWQSAQNNPLTALNQNSKQIIFEGVVVADPVFGDSQQLIVKPDGINGNILVFAAPYPQFNYGDRIKIKGMPQIPENFNGFDYQNYLAKSGVYSTIRYPEIELISQNNGNPAYSKLLWAKHRLESGINKILPAPHNSLLVAILFGNQSGLSGCSQKEIAAAQKDGGQCAQLKEKLNITGLRHLSAVSGTHVTIMAGILMALFIGFGLWRGQAFYLTLVFIWSFILMIGLPASAVRAGIMGSLMLLAQHIGRRADTIRVVTVAAAFMLLQNPMLLVFDIGFQLSYLAVLGMSFFQKPIESKLSFLPGIIKPALATTLAAQIFTLPLLVYNFGYISTYAPITNILVESFVSFITIYGFILSIASATNFYLGWLLLAPMWLALEYLLKITAIFSRLPFASLALELNFFWLIMIYLVLCVFTRRFHKKQRLEFLK